MGKLDGIKSKFYEKNYENKHLLHHNLVEAIEAIRQLTGDEEDVFDFILEIMENTSYDVLDFGLDDFKYVLELGVDLSYNINYIFAAACEHKNPAIAIYLILNNYICVSSFIDNESIMKYIVQHDELLQIVLDAGMAHNILDKAMVWCKKDVTKLNLLMEYGANLSPLINNAVNELFDKNLFDFILATVKSEKLNFHYDLHLLTRLLKICVLSYQNLPLDIVKILVDRGANPQKEDIFKYACANIRSTEIIKYFIEDCECDINANNSIALYYAIAHNNYDVVVLLLGLGITISDDTINYIARHGDSCPSSREIDIRIKYSNLLLKYGVPIEKIAQCFVEINFNWFKFLVQSGVDFNSLAVQPKN